MCQKFIGMSNAVALGSLGNLHKQQIWGWASQHESLHFAILCG